MLVTPDFSVLSRPPCLSVVFKPDDGGDNDTGDDDWDFTDDNSDCGMSEDFILNLGWVDENQRKK